jgi:hypothetical protein
MVMKYAHLSPKHQQNAVNALEGLFENKSYRPSSREIASGERPNSLAVLKI